MQSFAGCHVRLSGALRQVKRSGGSLWLLRTQHATTAMQTNFAWLLKPGLHVRRKHKHKHKHKKPTCKPVRRKHKRLVLALVFMLASSRFTRTMQRRKHKHKHKRMERFPFFCAYACVVASYV